MNDLHPYRLTELKDELKAGLRIQLETAWGWIDVAPRRFISAVEKRSGANATVTAYTDLTRNGSITLKIPRRI